MAHLQSSEWPGNTTDLYNLALDDPSAMEVANRTHSGELLADSTVKPGDSPGRVRRYINFLQHLTTR